jgi:hypothetical protein
MRILVLKTESELQPLRKLIAQPELAAKLARANPHINLATLQPGDVLVVPEDLGEEIATSGPPLGEGGPVLGNSLASFVEFAGAALAGAARGLEAGVKRQVADADAVAAALRSRGVKEALGGDAELARQVELAAKRARDDAKAAQTDLKQFEGQRERALKALEELQTLASKLG